MLDISRFAPGQIWYYRDRCNKYNLPRNEKVLRGDRYCYVLQATEWTATIIPTTSNPKYEPIGSGLYIEGGVKSYLAIDQIKTVNTDDLDRYTGTVDDNTKDNILKIISDWILGKIGFNKEAKAFTYKKEQEPVVLAAPVEEKEEEQIHVFDICEEEEVKVVRRCRKYNTNKSVHDIALIMCASANDEISINLSNNTINSYRAKYRKEYGFKEIMALSDNEKSYIINNPEAAKVYYKNFKDFDVVCEVLKYYSELNKESVG